MKIIHIGEASSVACVLATYQNRMGHNATVLEVWRDAPDVFLDTYGFKPIPRPSMLKRITMAALYVSRGGWYLNDVKNHIKDADILHLHGFHRLIPAFKKIAKSAKIILHHHGSALRDATPKERTFQMSLEEKVDVVLVATEDLLRYGPSNAIWLPNPCDTKMFKQKLNVRQTSDVINVLRIESPYQPNSRWLKHAYDVLPKILQSEYIVKTLPRTIPYSKMPQTLAAYDVYLNFIDIGFLDMEKTTHMNGHSMLALQSLAMGLGVVGMDLCLYKGLPDQHRPENVCRVLEGIYSQ